MRLWFFALGALLLLGHPATAQNIKIVATCPPGANLTVSPPLGQVQYMDQSGNLCVSAAGGTAPAPAATTPAAGAASATVTGGVAVTLITGPVNGCYVVNPLSAADQNIATAEVAQVNPVTTAAATGRGTNVTLQPGQSFSCPSGMTTNLSAMAATTAHAFVVVKW
jgi:hypothetical protein